jgi:hypothetical protein
MKPFMKKPYYDPQTKETYIKGKWENIEVKFVTGSVEIGGPNRPTIWRNELGEVIKTEPFIEYVKIL